MFGPHVNREKSSGGNRRSIVSLIETAKSEAKDNGFLARAFQIFVAGPRKLLVTLTEDESRALAEYVKTEKTRVISHGTYLDSPWGGNAYLARFIRAELALCARSGISGLVVHLSSAPPTTVLKYLPRLVTNVSGTTLYLETPHVKPANSHYETPEKLAVLFSMIRAKLDKNLRLFGLCIDTAHLWSCGVDLSSYKKARGWLKRLEAISDVVPPGRIMIHLNDSLDDRGSGVDHHAGLGKGKIWGEYAENMKHSGLAAFVEYAVENDTTVILERKPPSALLDDYAVIRLLTPAVRTNEGDSLANK